jgi:putative ABC transport system ATP-binding protein
VLLDGRDLGALGEDERARVQAETVGFVFQSFHLIPTLTARENVQVPLELRGEDGRARADELLQRVGLGDRGHHYPAQLSGGEQQRVAVARAFANRPKLLFADEPTGNLDAANGQNVVELLAELNRELGTTVVLVTHEPDLAARAHRVLRLRDGAVVKPRRPRRPSFILAWRAQSGLAGGAHSSSGGGDQNGALVAINSFTDNLRESVGREARALLGADLALSSASPFSPAAEALLAEVRNATDPPAEVARVVSFGAMAFRPRGQTTRLVRVQAVDPGYPYYGAIETSPAGEWPRLAETGGAIADTSLLQLSRARAGDGSPRRGR